MKKNKAAQELARKRHLSLTPARRREIAMIANKKRWLNHKPKKLSTGKIID